MVLVLALRWLKSSVHCYSSPEMCYANKDEVTGRIWRLSPCPRLPIKVNLPRGHPTLLSIARVTGEVSRQRVAYFFPFASHCWLGAPGSRGRQGAGLCRGTSIVSTTIPLDRQC